MFLPNLKKSPNGIMPIALKPNIVGDACLVTTSYPVIPASKTSPTKGTKPIFSLIS
jgi:hypothetical protein